VSDENTTDDPDMTPTESIELADQEPLSAPVLESAAAPAAPRNHTRTIIEVIGGVVAVGLIFVAAAGGFVAGMAVGDDRHGDDDWSHMAQYDDDGRGYDDDEYGRGMGEGGMGRGYDGNGQEGMGRGYDGNGQEGMGRGFGDRDFADPQEMFDRFMEEFGQDFGMGDDSPSQ
jgi:hypothetical protein